MRLKAWLLLVFLLAGAAVVSWQQATRASACSCALLTTPEYAELADLVAEGVVVGVDRPADAQSSADDATYTVELTRLWKGPEVSHVPVLSALHGASCGIEGINENMVIALFATDDGGLWRASLCGGTAPMSDALAAELTSALGEPTKVSATAATPAPTAKPAENTATLMWVGLAVTGVALALLAGVAWYRSRR